MNKRIPQILIEDSRAKLIGQSKSSQKGMQRYNRRVKSRVANTVKQYNSIDMNKLFKEDILTVNINVNGETDDYIVRISFGGFSDLIQEEIKRGGDKLDLRTIIRALVKGFNQEDVYVHCSCLHPDTKIKLLDGTCPTVEDMKKRFDNGEKLYVYSVDKNGDFIPGVVEDVFITKETSDFIKVTLDNGEEILTTPEHRYMLRNGEWEEAQNLVEGQPLMPVHKVVKIERVTLGNTPVYDISVKDHHNFCVDAGVILHNCDDFRYRFNYWATRDDINSGTPEFRPSNITNPDNSLGSACKHILLVLNNNAWIIKVASVINNYIKYMTKNYEKLYADIIYPSVYGKKYTGAVQTKMFDDEKEIATDTGEIDKAIEYGKKSAQFQKGNKQGYKFVSNKDKDQQSIEDVEEED